MCGWRSSISQPNFAASSESAVQCAIRRCHGGESPFIAKKTGTVSHNCLSQTSLWQVTPQTFKRNKFSKWVTMLNCHSCAAAVHMPWLTWLWTQESSVFCINGIWNLNEFGILHYGTCKLVLWPTLKLGYVCITCVRYNPKTSHCAFQL